MLHPGDIRLAIVTVSRWPEYIHTMLASLFLSDPLVSELKGIHLIVGAADAEYLRHYRHHSRVQIHPMQKSKAEEAAAWNPRQKISLNYHRALVLPPPDCAGICVCEDDIVFQDGFVSSLLACIEEMEVTHKVNNYLLDLYLPYCVPRDTSFKNGLACAKYVARSFYGRQCLYYPRGVLPEIASFMYEQGVMNYRRPGDMLIREYATAHGNLYGSIRSLVQHIGFHSSSTAGFSHHAPSFGEGVPALSFTAFDSANLAMQSIRFDFRESLVDSLKAIALRAHSKNVEVICDIDSRVPVTLIGDPALLAQTIGPLMQSALNCAQPGHLLLYVLAGKSSAIDVDLELWIVRASDETAFAEVSNIVLEAPEQSACIIPGCYLAHLHLLVRNLGGQLWSADYPGRVVGFKFTANFQFERAAPFGFGVDPGGKVFEAPVLVVDDNTITARVLANMLSAWGADAIVVGSGEEALAKLKKQHAGGCPIGLILLDVQMPGMDGFAVARAIRQTSQWSDPPIMLLADWSLGDLRERCAEVGIKDYLTKPVMHSELLEALQYFSERQRWRMCF